jgi:hypothetical protein
MIDCKVIDTLNVLGMSSALFIGNQSTASRHFMMPIWLKLALTDLSHISESAW